MADTTPPVSTYGPGFTSKNRILHTLATFIVELEGQIAIANSVNERQNLIHQRFYEIDFSPSQGTDVGSLFSQTEDLEKESAAVWRRLAHLANVLPSLLDE